jgi:hypothetical protein
VSLSDILGIIALAVALLGIPFTYWLARRGRQRPDVRFAIDTDLLVDPEHDLLSQGVEVRFRNQQISRVSRSYVAIWNRQGDLVRGIDIVPTDPLRIIPSDDDDEFLQARIIAMSRPQIKPEVEPSQTEPGCIQVDFDFLEEGDGFVIEILHKSDDYPELAGTVRGAPLREQMAFISIETMRNAQKNWVRRLGRPRLVIPVGALLAATLALAWIAVPTLPLFVGDPQLVEADRFDVATLEGQRDLSKAIREAGNLEGPPWWLHAITFLLIAGALFVAFSYISAFRTRIPSNVLRLIESPASTADAETRECKPGEGVS